MRDDFVCKENTISNPIQNARPPMYAWNKHVTNDYSQVLANPPLRFAEWSGDKNLYCTPNNITTCVLCVLWSRAKYMYIVTSLERYNTFCYADNFCFTIT